MTGCARRLNVNRAITVIHAALDRRAATILMSVMTLPEPEASRATSVIDSAALAYFLRVVEFGSINRAAENLGVSQPTLSRALQSLETQVGQRLLLRTHQGVTVTPAGELMAERSRPILAQIEQLQQTMGTDGVGRLAVGLPTSWGRLVTTPLAARLLERWPAMKLRVYDGINNHLREWMEQGLLDFGVMLSLEHVPASFESVPLVSEPLLLVGPALEGRACGSTIAMPALGSLSMILPGRPNTIRTLVENSMGRGNIAYRCAVEAETLGACLNLTRAGLGWTIMPRSAVTGAELDVSSAYPIAGLALTWDLCINRLRRHSRLVNEGVSELHVLVRRLVESGGWPDARLIGDPSLQLPA